MEGIGDRWQSFVALLKAVWQNGSVPTQMTWMIIVLLLKGGGNYCSIGLLNPTWKVIEKVMVAQLSVIELHDCLHGRLLRRGTGTAIMEVKLQQQLVWVDQQPLYQIYLDLRKAYDALDWERCLEILAGYGVGPNLLRLQKKSGTTQRWYVVWVVIMVFLLRLIMESHRGASFQHHVQYLCRLCHKGVAPAGAEGVDPAGAG